MRSAYKQIVLAAVLVLLVGNIASAQRRNFFDQARRRIGQMIAGNRVDANERRNDKVLEAFKGVTNDAEKSLVRVFGEDGQVSMGIVVDAKGLIATKYGDLVGDLSVKLPDGESVQAEFAAIDKPRDLALLRVNRTDLKPVAWSASMDLPQLGSWVVTPGKGALPLSVGVVAAPARPIRAEPAFLGVSLENVQGGVKITELLDGGFAQKADILRVNDVVTEIDDSTVTTIPSMKAIIEGRRPLTAIKVKFNRGDETLTRRFLLGRRSDAKVFQQDQRMRFQQELGGRISERRDSFPLVLQHDAVLKPEECGSPILNLDGEVIGLNIARASRISSYAIPLSELLPSIERMRNGEGQDLITERRKLTKLLKEAKKKVDGASEALKTAQAKHKTSLDELKTVRVAIKNDDDDDDLLQEQLKAAVERSETLKNKSLEAQTAVRDVKAEVKDLEAMLISLRN